MKPLQPHMKCSNIAVTHISKYGIWLLNTTKELFIPFTEYPRFRDASVSNIFHVEQPTPNMLHWPHLGITLAIESLRSFPFASLTSHSPTHSNKRTQVTRITQSKMTIRRPSHQNNRPDTEPDRSQNSTEL